MHKKNTSGLKNWKTSFKKLYIYCFTLQFNKNCFAKLFVSFYSKSKHKLNALFWRESNKLMLLLNVVISSLNVSISQLFHFLDCGDIVELKINKWGKKDKMYKIKCEEWKGWEG